jgi:hypothetical protein
MFGHPKPGQNLNIRTANESFENATKLKYVGKHYQIKMTFMMK